MINKYNISDLTLAWEFLRRNPEYISEWNNLKKEKHYESQLYSKSAEKWGLLLYCDPIVEDVREVVWNCMDFDRYIRFVGLGEKHIYSKWDMYVNLSNYEGYSKMIKVNDDNMILSLSNNGEIIQLYSEGNRTEINKEGMLLIPLHLPEVYISSIIRIVNQVMGISTTKPMRYSNEKYLEYLSILDMRISKNSHKQIACKIYGQSEVDRHWYQDSWLRSKVRYKIQKAEEYMRGKYKILLLPPYG